MRQAQSYIVRVYARTGAGGLEGTVEIVRTGERRGFSSPEQLVSIVRGGPAAQAGGRASRLRPDPKHRTAGAEVPRTNKPGRNET